MTTLLLFVLFFFGSNSWCQILFNACLFSHPLYPLSRLLAPYFPVPVAPPPGRRCRPSVCLSVCLARLPAGRSARRSGCRCCWPPCWSAAPRWPACWPPSSTRPAGRWPRCRPPVAGRPAAGSPTGVCTPCWRCPGRCGLPCRRRSVWLGRPCSSGWWRRPGLVEAGGGRTDVCSARPCCGDTRYTTRPPGG